MRERRSGRTPALGERPAGTEAELSNVRVAEKSEVLLCIRPEDFELLSGPPRSPEDGRNVLEGTIETRAFLGNIVNLWVSCNGWRLRVQADPGFEFQHRDDNGKLYMRIREDRVKVLV